MKDKKFTIDDFVAAYAKHGCREVHRSWRDGMISQGRDVSAQRMNWDTLNEDDKILDEQIARDVVIDFWIWFTRELPFQKVQNSERSHDI